MAMGMMGRKVGMSQVYGENGEMVPVTVVAVGPCQVLSIKEKKSGSSLLLGYEERVKDLIKPVIGYFEKLGSKIGKKITPKKYLKEFIVSQPSSYKEGDVLHADIFETNEKVSVSGISKGKGTQGVMKRHNMHGGPGSHGSHFHRKPGSIGAASFPARVWKGQKMSGRMGNENVTVKNLTVFHVDAENNLLYIKGAVPGAKRSLVYIKKGLK
jgi:large subunit ribosomal protein L3